MSTSLIIKGLEMDIVRLREALQKIKDKLDHRNSYRFDQLTTDSFIHHIIEQALGKVNE